MSYYDYKVVPAPKRAKRMKGVHTPEELFAHTMTEAITEQSRQGWEYLRAETLPAEAPRGWLRRPLHEQLSVLVFRRPRENLGPRLAAVTHEAPEAREPLLGGEEAPRPDPAERPAPERATGLFRRAAPPRLEPKLGEPGEAPATPLRPTPRLGPAEP
jgi:hypothetical protein